MVHCRLGHQAQALIERGIDQRGKLVVVLTDVERVVVVNHSLAQRGELVVHDSALVRQRDVVRGVVEVTVFLEQFSFLLVPLCLLLRCGILKRLLDLSLVPLLVRVLLHVSQLSLEYCLHLGICKAERGGTVHQVAGFHVCSAR